jgi:hypothetical protein
MNTSVQTVIFLLNFIVFTTPEAEQPFLPNKDLRLRIRLKLLAVMNWTISNEP